MRPKVDADRGVAGDRYSLAFADQAGTELCNTPLSEATSFVVDEVLRSECNLTFDTPYHWYVYVASGNWSTGFGLSNYYGEVRFVAP
jgi:hypothetical protein